MSLSSTSTLPARDAARHLLARVRVARDAGLDTITFGDSHNRVGAHYFQNTPTLGRALAEWDPQRPAGCLFLLPFWPPVLVAEQVGTLAAFHDGPFIVQTGLGGGPTELARMGVVHAHRGAALDEAIRVIRALFAGETASSELFGIRDAHVDLVPPDGVRWWVGATSEAGLDRAARAGATWYAAHGSTEATLPAQAEYYRAACAAHGTTPEIALRRDAIVLPDGDSARRLADDALRAGYRGMTGEGIVAGTAPEVAAAVVGLRELGVDELMFRTMGVAPEVDLETIEQLGTVRELLR